MTTGAAAAPSVFGRAASSHAANREIDSDELLPAVVFINQNHVKFVAHESTRSSRLIALFAESGLLFNRE